MTWWICGLFGIVWGICHFYFVFVRYFAYLLTDFHNTYHFETWSLDLALSLDACPEWQIVEWNGQMFSVQLNFLAFSHRDFALICLNVKILHKNYIYIKNKVLRKQEMRTMCRLCLAVPSHAWHFFGLTLCCHSQSDRLNGYRLSMPRINLSLGFKLAASQHCFRERVRKGQFEEHTLSANR